jgi:hypothetical protein
LLTRCEDLAEKHQNNIFTAGLHNPLRTNVELENPVTLEDAMALARTYDQRLSLADDVSAHTPPAKASAFHTPSKPLSLPAPAMPAAPLPAPRMKRLSATEMAAKREKGECFNCTEKFSKEHLKTYPMKGVFLLQMEDSLISIEGNNDPLISLNVIIGMSSSEMMQLQCQVQEATLAALVDSRSTHSFISAAVVRRLDLQPEPRPDLTVRVANGDQVASDGVYRATHVLIGSKEFILDLFMIPLDGFDIVLGVQWLRSLGPILWDFDRCHMSSWRINHQVLW